MTGLASSWMFTKPAAMTVAVLCLHELPGMTVAVPCLHELPGMTVAVPCLHELPGMTVAVPCLHELLGMTVAVPCLHELPGMTVAVPCLHELPGMTVAVPCLHELPGILPGLVELGHSHGVGVLQLEQGLQGGGVYQLVVHLGECNVAVLDLLQTGELHVILGEALGPPADGLVGL